MRLRCFGGSMSVMKASSTRAPGSDHSPSDHLAQLQHLVGGHQRVMVREADDSGPQLYVLGTLGGGPYKYLSGRDGLPAGPVVFAYPCLIEPKPFQRFDQLHVTFERQSGVLTKLV